MTEPEFLGRAVGRIHIWIQVLSIAGCLAATLMGGWRAGAGFLVGALASWLNFRWLRRMVESLGEGATGKPRVRGAVFMGLRYLLLGLCAYVILRFSTLSLPALLAGIFVAVAAVIVEILFELLYARI